ncbi:Arc family DNA-binding protein [Pseudomonas cichorii]|nr:Arc family DNA-binding protein [Pseudomonas cichorii]MBX8556992.1 Arc family DNA-binding protein [Pseudomonas cichorii]MBX8592733.1 Arc family DNA-binding protein [Pseudomonas cichorii]
MTTTSRDADKFVVRLPDGMRDRIHVVALSNHRSMNSEILERLERTFNEDATGVLNVALVEQLSNRCKELESQLEAFKDQSTVELLKRALEQVTSRCEELEARASGANLKVARG